MYPSEGNFVVWGDRSQGRAFLHVDDAVDALVSATRPGLGHVMVQIGPSVCTSFREVAEAVVKISGKNIKIHYDTSQPTEKLGTVPTNPKLRPSLGWGQD